MSTQKVLAKKNKDSIDKILASVNRGQMIGFEVAVKLLWAIALSEYIFDALTYVVNKVTVRDVNTVIMATPLFIKEVRDKMFRYRYDNIAQVLVACFREQPTIKRLLYDEVPDLKELLEMYDAEANSAIIRYRAALSTKKGPAFVKANPSVVSYYTDMFIAGSLVKDALAGRKDDELWLLRQNLAAYDNTYNAVNPLESKVCPHGEVEQIVDKLDQESLMSFDDACDIATIAFTAPSPSDAERLFDYLFYKLRKADMITINVAITMVGVMLHGRVPKTVNIGERLPQLIALMNNYAPFKHYIRSSEVLNKEVMRLGDQLIRAGGSMIEHTYLAVNPDARSYAVDRMIALTCFTAYVNNDQEAVDHFMRMRERINNTRG